MSDNTTKTDIRKCQPVLQHVRQCVTPETKSAITVYTQKQEEVFSLKFGTQIREVTLNMGMMRRTAPCQTGSL